MTKREAAEKWAEEHYGSGDRREERMSIATFSHLAGQEYANRSCDEDVSRYEELMQRDLAELREKDAEIARLRGMVLDLYLWLNAGMTKKLARLIPDDKWREIKSVVGQAADEEKR